MSVLLAVAAPLGADPVFICHWDEALRPDFVSDAQASIRPAAIEGDPRIGRTAGRPGFGGSLETTPGHFFFLSEHGDLATVAPARAGTIEFWMAPDAPDGAAAGTSRQILFMFGEGRGQHSVFDHRYIGLFLSTDPPAERTTIWFNAYGSEVLDEKGDVQGWKPGTWHHVAVTWDFSAPEPQGGEVALFVDGRRVSTAELSRRPEPTGLGEVLWIGGLGDRDRFRGRIDELVIWDEVRYRGPAFDLPSAPVASTGHVTNALKAIDKLLNEGRIDNALALLERQYEQVRGVDDGGAVQSSPAERGAFILRYARVGQHVGHSASDVERRYEEVLKIAPGAPAAGEAIADLVRMNDARVLRRHVDRANGPRELVQLYHGVRKGLLDDLEIEKVPGQVMMMARRLPRDEVGARFIMMAAADLRAREHESAAQRLLRIAVDADPDAVFGRECLRYELRRLALEERFEEADAWARRVVDSQPGTDSDRQARVYLAERQCEQGAYLPALRVIDGGEEEGGTKQAWLERADAASALLDRFGTRLFDVHHLHIYDGLADAFRLMNRNDVAAALYARLAGRLDDGSWRAREVSDAPIDGVSQADTCWFWIGLLHGIEGRDSGAIACLHRYLGADDASDRAGVASLALARLLIADGNAAGASDHVERAERILGTPAASGARGRMEKALRRANERLAAIEASVRRAADEGDPQVLCRALMEAASACVEAGLDRRAIEIYRQVRREFASSPEAGTAYLAEAAIMIHRQDDEAARRLLIELMRSAPDTKTARKAADLWKRVVE